MFKHHPDNWIYIEGDRYPLDWFLTQEPDYSLPEGAIGREYAPEENRHSLYSSDSQWGNNVPWEAGDRYISKKNQYRAAWETSQNPDPTSLAEAKASANLEIDALRVEKESVFQWTKPATLTTPAQVYPVQSDLNSRMNFAGAMQAAQLGLWKPGATWRMASNVEVVMSASDINSMAIASFAHIEKCYRAAFAHKRAIARLETVAEVLAYDVTQGWG